MKKGKWNYSEDIEYRVILVKLHHVSDPKMHWQNAFVGEERQVVEISTKTANGIYVFLIDNNDGYGLLKISRGGGPDSFSAHVDGGFDFVKELPENEWQQTSKVLHDRDRAIVNEWQKTNFPDEFEKLEALRNAIIHGNYPLIK